MTTTAVVFDTRLGPPGARGKPKPGLAEQVVLCNETLPLFAIVTALGVIASAYAGISVLRLISHGFTSGGAGGLGLKLCKENLLPANLAALSPLKGRIGRIFVYGCRAADKPSPLDPAPSGGDGWMFLMTMAQVTAAEVVGSNALQYYDPSRGFIAALAGDAWEMDPGAWEGTLRLFDPKSGTSRIYDPRREGA